MKVKDTAEISATQPVAQGRPQLSKLPSAEQPLPVAADRVSQAALAAVKDVAVAASQSRATRVQQIMAEVRQGTYVPNVQQVADRILDDAEVTAHLQSMLQR